MAVKVIFCIITAAIALLFIAAIPTIGNRSKSLGIHREMSPDAGAMIVNAKGIITVFAGIAYILAIVGIMFGIRPFLLVGTVGASLFAGFYLIELFLWAFSHPMVWFGFATFGLHSIVTGAYCVKLYTTR